MDPHAFHSAFDIMENGFDVVEALKSGDVETLKLALERENCEKQLHVRDDFDRTPLHVASCRGFTEIVKILCEFGADANAKDHQGNTPLHWCGHIEIAEILLECGANAASLNKMDMAPWQLAERRGVSESVLQLLKYHCELSKSKSAENAERRQTLPSIWQEFCYELGLKNVFMLVCALLCFSLFVAYKLTGYPRNSEIKIPVDFQTTRFDI